MRQDIFKRIIILLLPFVLSGCSGYEPEPQSLGKNDSMLVEVFSDVQCPACADIIPKIEDLIEKNTALAELHYYHYPLSQHELAFLGAQATECAGQQGAFWDFLNLIYQQQAILTEDAFYKTASSLGLDSSEFKACLNDGLYREKISEHIKEGQLRKISATPSLFINGHLVEWNDLDEFEQLLR